MEKLNPEDFPIGHTKIFNGDMKIVVWCGNKKKWQSLDLDRFKSMSYFFDLQPVFKFRYKWIKKLRKSSQDRIRLINTKLAKSLAKNDILFDIVIVPQSDHPKVDQWTDYAHSYMTTKHDCGSSSYMDHPYVYAEYRVRHDGTLYDDGAIQLYSNIRTLTKKKKFPRAYDAYELILINLFEKKKVYVTKKYDLDFVEILI